MTDGWYFQKPGGQKSGPHKKSSLESMYRAGQLKGSDLVWLPHRLAAKPCSDVFNSSPSKSTGRNPKSNVSRTSTPSIVQRGQTLDERKYDRPIDSERNTTGNYNLFPAFLLFVIFYGLVHIFAASVGIAFHIGPVWSFLIVFFSLMFRFTAPITIGAFFGAMDVWEWHWVFAILFALPGLLFVVPGIVLSLSRGR